MYILGFSSFYHDSDACLIRDTEIGSAAQEERFPRAKHDYRYPKMTIECRLKSNGIKELLFLKIKK